MQQSSNNEFTVSLQKDTCDVTVLSTGILFIQLDDTVALGNTATKPYLYLGEQNGDALSAPFESIACPNTFAWLSQTAPNTFRLVLEAYLIPSDSTSPAYYRGRLQDTLVVSADVILTKK